MQELGANSIRIYHVHANEDHDDCMSAFSDAGVYAWIDLDTFDTYILPDGGQAHWNNTQLEAYQRVMDTFVKYDNVAGFFVGNEMLTTGPDSAAAPYIKAAARDLKAYRDRKGYRKIPIGYTAADITSLRPNLQNYLACGDNSSEALDFYGLNVSKYADETVTNTDLYRRTSGAANHHTKCLGTLCSSRMPRATTFRSSCLRQVATHRSHVPLTIKQSSSVRTWPILGPDQSFTSGFRRPMTMAWSLMDHKQIQQRTVVPYMKALLVAATQHQSVPILEHSAHIGRHSIRKVSQRTHTSRRRSHQPVLRTRAVCGRFQAMHHCRRSAQQAQATRQLLVRAQQPDRPPAIAALFRRQDQHRWARTRNTSA